MKRWLSPAPRKSGMATTGRSPAEDLDNHIRLLRGRGGGQRQSGQCEESFFHRHRFNSNQNSMVAELPV